eukprot:gene10942-12939_t
MAQLAATADAVYDSVDTDDDISNMHNGHGSVGEDRPMGSVCRRYSNSPPSVEGAELEAANHNQQQVLTAFKRRSVISCFMPRASFAAMNTSGSDDNHGLRTHGNAADRTMHRTSQPLRERNPPSDVSTSTVAAGDEHSPQMSDSSSTLLSRQELQRASQDGTQQSDAGKVAGEEMQTQRENVVLLGNNRSNSPAHVVQVYLDQEAHAGVTCRLKHPASMMSSEMHRSTSVRRLQSGKRRRPPPRAASTEHSSMQPALLLQRPATQAALRVLPFALFDSDGGDQPLTQHATLGNTTATDDRNSGGVDLLDLRYTSSGTTDHDNVRVLNARALFKILKINIFRLQLCIPLDYLEDVATQDYRRRKSELPSLDSHLEIEKSRVDPVSFAGFQSADLHNAAQRLEEASPAGAAASHAQSSAEAVAEANTSAADPAFLSMNAILSKQDLNAQSVRASLLPWQMSDGRPFS